MRPSSVSPNKHAIEPIDLEEFHKTLAQNSDSSHAILSFANSVIERGETLREHAATVLGLTVGERLRDKTPSHLPAERLPVRREF